VSRYRVVLFILDVDRLPMSFEYMKCTSVNYVFFVSFEIIASD